MDAITLEFLKSCRRDIEKSVTYERPEKNRTSSPNSAFESSCKVVLSIMVGF